MAHLVILPKDWVSLTVARPFTNHRVYYMRAGDVMVGKGSCDSQTKFNSYSNLDSKINVSIQQRRPSASALSA